MRPLIALMALLLWLPAYGQSEVSPDASFGLQFSPQSVLILPIRDWTNVSPETLFHEGGAQSEDTKKMEDLTYVESLHALLTKDPRFRPILPIEIVQKLPGNATYGARVELTRDRYNTGLDHYEELRLKSALKNLEIASTKGQEQYLQFLRPGLFARIQFALGLAYMEVGENGKAHVAFKHMFRVKPARKFRKGYYPKDVEKALKSALLDLMETELDDWTVDEKSLRRLMKDLNSERAIELSIVNQRLLVRATDGTQNWQDSAIIEKENGLAKSLLYSRLLSCITGKLAGPKAKRSLREFRLDLNLAHGIYLKHPTRKPTNHVGLSSNGTYRINRYLNAALKLELLSAIKDELYDLQSSFTTVRAVISAGFGFHKRRWMWFLRPGLDLSYMSRFMVVTNPDCKFFGYDSSRCDPKNVEHTPAALLTGLNIGAGTAYHFTSEVYLSLQAGLSYAISFQAPDTPYNLLLSSEFGLGYLF